MLLVPETELGRVDAERISHKNLAPLLAPSKVKWLLLDHLRAALMSSSSIRKPFYFVLLLLMALRDDYRIKTNSTETVRALAVHSPSSPEIKTKIPEIQVDLLFLSNKNTFLMSLLSLSLSFLNFLTKLKRTREFFFLLSGQSSWCLRSSGSSERRSFSLSLGKVFSLLCGTAILIPYALFALCLSESRDLSFCPFLFSGCAVVFLPLFFLSFSLFFPPITPNVPSSLFFILFFYSSTLFIPFCLVAFERKRSDGNLAEPREWDERRRRHWHCTPLVPPIPGRLHNKHAGTEKRHLATITRSSSTSYTSQVLFVPTEVIGATVSRPTDPLAIHKWPSKLGLSLFLVHLDRFFSFTFFSSFLSVLSLGLLLDVTVSGVDRTKKSEKKKSWGAASRRQYGSIQSFSNSLGESELFSNRRQKKTGFPISLLTFSNFFLLIFCVVVAYFKVRDGIALRKILLDLSTVSSFFFVPSDNWTCFCIYREKAVVTWNWSIHAGSSAFFSVRKEHDCKHGDSISTTIFRVTL